MRGALLSDTTFLLHLLAAAAVKSGGELTLTYDEINRPMELEVEEIPTHGNDAIRIRATPEVTK